jgi:Permuted papain-like amidase enzyme, YaeF/YiiX, C92 family
MLTDSASARKITEGTATVLSIAEHFANLKQRVLEIETSIHASERGFFTPTEDEQARHFQISFWQSRNALFELVSSIHRIDMLPEEHHSAALLVAYSGALVLVDAARFLREQFHQRPVVRAKLNEAESHFGIPDGIYDLVQNSLTSPVHAWHLYHAGRYLDDRQEALDPLIIRWPELSRLEDIVECLQHRLHVSPADYALARVRVRSASAASGGLELLTRAIYGLQKCVSQLVSSYYVRPGHSPQLPEEICLQFVQLLQPGDVLVTRKEFALTNYFLPGYWPHAALFMGSIEQLQELRLHEHPNLQPHWQHVLDCDPETPHRVLEALKDGIRIRSVMCPLSSDAVTVVRPRLQPSDIAAAIGRGLSHEGKPYDFDFDFTRSDRLVCTEVVYRSYEGIGGMDFPLTRRAGRMTLSAEDLLYIAIGGKSFHVAAVYCPAMSSRMEFGSDAERIIRETAQPPVA